MNEVLHALSPHERSVVVGKFFDDLNLREVGDQRGVCRERARQLEQRALLKMQRRLRLKGLTGADV